MASDASHLEVCRKLAAGAALSALLLAAQTSPLLAQAGLPTPSSTAPADLPPPSHGVQSSVRINSSNAAQYRSVIIPELYPLVKNGTADLLALNGLPFEWRYDEGFQNTAAPADSSALQADGAFKNGTKAFRSGLIFGTSDIVKKESGLDRLAQMAAWNMQSATAAGPILDSEFELLWLKNRQLQNRVRGVLTRAYVPLLGGSDKTVQLFREMVKFRSPTAISDLSLLTFRFLSPDEDFLWMYSPAIKKVRQLTGSNRSDSLMQSLISLDDFLGWSGKTELVEPVIERTLVALVPFPSVEVAELVDVDPNCRAVKEQFPPESASGDSSRWALDSQGRASSALLTPSGTVFVPRQLWRLELRPKDPFSAYGRQVLYLDSGMMLPVYKIVYLRSGAMTKMVVNSWGLAATKDQSRRRPYSAFTLALDAQDDASSVIDYIQPTLCDAFPQHLELSDFDPSRLAALAEATPLPLPPRTPVPVKTPDFDSAEPND